MKLAYTEQALQLSVIDDGRGFVPRSGGNGLNGYGLTSMRQRAEGLGGRIIIESQPQHGTQIVACIPRIREANTAAMAA
jgi:signal transduction histidine kinase